MKRLLDDLLDVSRVSQGKIELRKQPVELATLLLQAVEVSRPLIDREAAAARADAGASEPMPLDADPTRVVQVFANIAEQRRQVHRRRRPHHAVVGGRGRRGGRQDPRRRHGDAAPSCCARAFDLFVQETRAFDRAQGGLGIGLTMVRTLVKMHGGSVQAFSDGPGRGSELVVRLPLGAAVTAPAARAAAAAPQTGAGAAAARAGGRRQRRRRGRDEARAASWAATG